MNKNSKLTYSDIQEKIKEKFGYQPYIYLTKEEDYQSSIKNIRVKCKKCGHEFEARPIDLYKKELTKARCINCNGKENKEKLKNKGKEIFINFINNYKDDIEFLFDISDYQGCHKKLKYRCKKCGHEFEINFCNLKNRINKGIEFCPNCHQIKLFHSEEKRREGFEIYLKQLKEKNKDKYELKFEDFWDKSTKMKHKCKICGFEFEAIPSNILYAKHHYCPNCNKMVRDTTPHRERVLKLSNGLYEPLDEYKTRYIKLRYLCHKCGKIWIADPNNVLNGEGCPNCSHIKITSNGEEELLSFLKSFYDGEIILNSRKIIAPRELDIYLPELNIGFEYSGLYWHNEKHKGKNYHYEKYKLCHNKGITLINILEDGWKHKNNIVKNRIKYIMGYSNKPKVYARKCEVKEISSKQKDLFLEKYHLQGKDNSSIKLGLIYENKIVSVMTFTKKRACLGNKNIDDKSYELCRFASSDNYIVIGAFSKLLSYFQRNYDYKEIITYADLRWSNGNLYEKNGFKLDHISKPNYWYVHRNRGTKKYHRYQFRKSKLKSLFLYIYDNNLSESAIMEKANYYRIFDAGNLVFKLKNNF